MPRANVRNVIQAMSLETTDLLEVLDDGALFRKFPANISAPPVPTRQKTPDNMVGEGRPYPKKGKPMRFDPRDIAVQGALTNTVSVRLIRLALGGAVDETVNTTPNLTTDSLIHMLDAGSQPLLFNLLRDNDGLPMLHANCYVESFTIDQQGDAEPSFDARIRNNGHFKELPDTAIDDADIEPMTTYLKMHGVKTGLTFSDGALSYDFPSEGRLLGVNFQYNQNCIVEGMIGDPFVVPTNECVGAMSKNIYIDVQSAITRLTVYMDGGYDEFDAWLLDKSITSLSILFRTCEIIVGTHLFEIEIKVPISEINLAGGLQGNFSTFTVELPAVDGDPTTGDLVQARIRHLTSQDIEDIL